MDFKNLIGQKIVAIIPFLNPDKLTEMTVLGVDVGGLWVESEVRNSIYASALGLRIQDGLRTPAVFVPFHEIRAAFAKKE